jgi:hypothetical protein
VGKGERGFGRPQPVCVGGEGWGGRLFTPHCLFEYDLVVDLVLTQTASSCDKYICCLYSSFPIFCLLLLIILWGFKFLVVH